MSAINKIAKKHKLKSNRGSCHAILAKYKGKIAGNLSDLGCFSMHPLKT